MEMLAYHKLTYVSERYTLAFAGSGPANIVAQQLSRSSGSISNATLPHDGTAVII